MSTVFRSSSLFSYLNKIYLFFYNFKVCEYYYYVKTAVKGFSGEEDSHFSNHHPQLNIWFENEKSYKKLISNSGDYIVDINNF